MTSLLPTKDVRRISFIFLDCQDTLIEESFGSSCDETSDIPSILGGPADRDPVAFSHLPVQFLENNLLLVTDARCIRAACSLFRPDQPCETLDGLVIVHMRD